MKVITVTLSPALDVEYSLRDELNPHGLNRSFGQRINAGGKGINVSRCVKRLAERDGVSAEKILVTFAPVGGESGEMLKALLTKENLPLTEIQIDGETRINVSVIPPAGKSAEINAPGTPIGDRRAALEEKLLSLIEDGDVVVIAGSCPKDIEKSYPSHLIGEIRKRGGYAVLDCDGEALRIAVGAEEDCCPNLIKPNTDELAELTGMPTETAEEVARAAETIGGITVIATMAGDGSVLTHNGKSEFFPTQKRIVKRLKGAGDTFLGAFVYEYCCRGADIEEAMRYASDVAGEYVAGDER